MPKVTPFGMQSDPAEQDMAGSMLFRSDPVDATVRPLDSWVPQFLREDATGPVHSGGRPAQSQLRASGSSELSRGSAQSRTSKSPQRRSANVEIARSQTGGSSTRTSDLEVSDERRRSAPPKPPCSEGRSTTFEPPDARSERRGASMVRRSRVSAFVGDVSRLLKKSKSKSTLAREGVAAEAGQFAEQFAKRATLGEIGGDQTKPAKPKPLSRRDVQLNGLSKSVKEILSRLDTLATVQGTIVKHLISVDDAMKDDTCTILMQLARWQLASRPSAGVASDSPPSKMPDDVKVPYHTTLEPLDGTDLRELAIETIQETSPAAATVDLETHGDDLREPAIENTLETPAAASAGDVEHDGNASTDSADMMAGYEVSSTSLHSGQGKTLSTLGVSIERSDPIRPLKRQDAIDETTSSALRKASRNVTASRCELISASLSAARFVSDVDPEQSSSCGASAGSPGHCQATPTDAAQDERRAAKLFSPPYEDSAQSTPVTSGDDLSSSDMSDYVDMSEEASVAIADNVDQFFHRGREQDVCCHDWRTYHPTVRTISRYMMLQQTSTSVGSVLDSVHGTHDNELWTRFPVLAQFACAMRLFGLVRDAAGCGYWGVLSSVLATVACAQQIGCRVAIFLSITTADADWAIRPTVYGTKTTATCIVAVMALLARSYTHDFFAKPYFWHLAEYARTRKFLDAWSSSLRYYCVIWLPMGVCAGVATGYDIGQDFERQSEVIQSDLHWLFTPVLVYPCAVISALWLMVLTLVSHALLSAAALAQDAYVVWLTRALTPARVLSKYSSLSAFTRVISEVLSYPIVLAFPLLPGLLLVQCVGALDHGSNLDFGQLMNIIAGMSVLLSARNVTRSAERIPLIVQQMNFGKEVDIDRWCITSCMNYDLAAIRLFGGSVINTFVLAKAVWFILLGGFMLLTQLRTVIV